METKEVKIAALQETKLTHKSKDPNSQNYTLVRKDRLKDKGGGLAFLVHKSIQFEVIPDAPPDPHLETQGIRVGDTSIINIYLPPNSSCSSDYHFTLLHFLNMKDTIILGDFNAHDSLWHSQLSDERGRNLAEEIGNADYGVLNEDHPTRLPTNGTPSSPDIAMASLSLLPYVTWETKTELGSDHLPILITVETDIKPTISDNRTFINFRKADWLQFQTDTEIEFSKLIAPNTVHKGEKAMRKIINKAAKQNIPAGRIKSIIPEIPTEAASKIRERDELRQQNHQLPRIAELNNEIESLINNHKREKWRETIEEKKTDTTKLFKLLKHLNGGKKASDNEAIKFKGKYITTPKKIADSFNKQYSTVIPHTSTRTARIVNKDIDKNKVDETEEITVEQTQDAMKRAKASKAIGPDGIATVHLKHLGPYGIKYLTSIYNLSMKTSTIPDIWKTSTIIPLLKPGKPAEESTSYRPVSLLCPAIKILERILLPTLTDHLPIPDIQHGFRARHSTVTALHEFTEAIAGGFNKKKPADRTLLVQIDLSKAFDMVSHEKLLKDLNNTTLPGYIKRWMKSYLHGRQSRVNFRNVTSTAKNVRRGVPQGAVTSPILFNFYLSQLPPIPTDVKLIQYADDISIYIKGTNVTTLSKTVNSFLNTLTEFLDERELIVSPEKSTVTWFTPATAEANIQPVVFIKNKPVKLDKTPKLLGITFDTMFCFGPHVKQTVAKAKTKLNLLKALAGSKWGCHKETLILTYKSIVRSVLEYGSPVWSPIIKESNWKRLQSVQNQALRIATGCLSMSAVEHLHQETKVLPIKDHCEMVGKQFLASCHLADHPGQKLLKLDPHPRRMKPTIITEYLPIVANLYTTTEPSTSEYKLTTKIIHTTSVKDTMESYKPNKVLNTTPPMIDQSEQTLTRKARSELARLRSGYSRNLNYYMSRLDPDVQDECPHCKSSPHNTQHLFNCSSNPTELTILDLWTRPTLAAEFLKLDDDPP